MNPLPVSVLMAVHDGAGLLERTLRSLQGQHFQDFELVVVDDGSMDHSSTVVEAAGDFRFRVIRQSNTGLTRALNRGIGECRGEFIARIDCGDSCHPDRLGKQLDFMRSNPGVLALGCRVRRLDSDGVVLGYSEVVCDPRHIHAGLMRINLFQHSSLMMRRDALERAGGYRPFFRYAQDLDLLLRLSETGTLGNLPEVLSDWVIDKDSISFRRRSAQEAYAAIARRCATERREGRPDPLDTGEAHEPEDVRKSDNECERLYRMELARSCMMGGDRRRLRNELHLARNSGQGVRTVFPLWLASWLPGFMLTMLRGARVRLLTRCVN